MFPGCKPGRLEGPSAQGHVPIPCRVAIIKIADKRGGLAAGSAPFGILEGLHKPDLGFGKGPAVHLGFGRRGSRGGFPAFHFAGIVALGPRFKIANAGIKFRNLSLQIGKCLGFLWGKFPGCQFVDFRHQNAPFGKGRADFSQTRHFKPPKKGFSKTYKIASTIKRAFAKPMDISWPKPPLPVGAWPNFLQGIAFSATRPLCRDMRELRPPKPRQAEHP